MAVVGTPNSPRRPYRPRGLFVARATCGKLVVQRWPRKRGTPKCSYLLDLVERFRLWTAHIKELHWREVFTTKEMLSHLNSVSRGQKGSAIIRERDWYIRVQSNRMWAFLLPDGKVLWPETVKRDVSDALDAISPRYGSLLVRGDDGWWPTVQCVPGRLLVMAPSVSLSSCCADASPAPRGEAIGGYEECPD